MLQDVVESDELLQLAIHNQDMLIKLLLEKGANLEHEDNQGETAFITAARQSWFEKHKEEMTSISDHPKENGYDSEVFIDKRTQASVKAMWIKTGQRRLAIQNLGYWLLFLLLLTCIAVSYSGSNQADAYAFEQGVKEKLVLEEWDDVEVKGLKDIGNLDDWKRYLNVVFIPNLFDQQFYYSHDNESVIPTEHTYRINGHGKSKLLSMLITISYQSSRLEEYAIDS